MASADSFMKTFAGNAMKFVDDIGNIEYMSKKHGLTKLRSNEAINPIAKFIMGEADTGIRGTLNAMANDSGFVDALKSAYRPDGKWNAKAIAGTYVGAAAAGRVLTGGGLYRDSTGNVNIPVVPFI